MDERTGEIREFPKNTSIPEGFIPLGRKPKTNCKYCYGRGYEGINDKGKYVPCRCTNIKKTKWKN